MHSPLYEYYLKAFVQPEWIEETQLFNIDE